MKRVSPWVVIFWMVGCATVDAPSEGELDDGTDETPGGSGGSSAGQGSGGVVISTGSGGLEVAGDGDGDGGGDGNTGGAVVGGDGDGDTGTGGVVIGGDGDGDTGGVVIGDGDTGGMAGDGDGDGDSGGTTSSGGAANPGSPGACLLDWDTTPEGDDCLNAGQADWESGCTNLLNCWQTNDCTPTECSSVPDDTCGQNTIMNATPGRSHAEGVFEALCN